LLAAGVNQRTMRARSERKGTNKTKQMLPSFQVQ
jgi:hypothetical protein